MVTRRNMIYDKQLMHTLKLVPLIALLIVFGCSGGKKSDEEEVEKDKEIGPVATCVDAGDSYDGSRPCCEGGVKTKVDTDSWICVVPISIEPRQENEWSPNSQGPYQVCPTQNGPGKAVTDGTGCLCDEGYIFNTAGNSCDAQVTGTQACPAGTFSATGLDIDGAGGGCTSCSMVGSTGDSNDARTTCLCQAGFSWDGSQCVAEPEEAEVEEGEGAEEEVTAACSETEWSVDGEEPCVACPGSADNGTGLSSEDRKACNCNGGYEWDSVDLACKMSAAEIMTIIHEVLF